MSMTYINTAYGTTYKLREYVRFMGRVCQIVGTKGAYLRLKDELGCRFLAHPTWEINKEASDE